MFLEKLGVFGWENIEKFCLASILTGDPLLLIGSPGTNKTGAARVLADAMELKFASYNAAMAVFDEVLGFPNVRDLSDGQVTYIETPRTIWGKEFVLVDELNRAAPELQSKWLELIRSREMMGTKTGTSFLWSAINPSETDEGAGELLAPLLSRFAFFIEVPTFWDLNEAQRISVSLYQGNDDAPGLGQWGASPYQSQGSTDSSSIGKEIREMLGKAAHIYGEIREEFGAKIGRFISQFGEELATKTKGEISLGGRSIGLLARSLMATWAIEVTMRPEEANFASSVCGVLMNCIPLADGDEMTVSRSDAKRQIENLFHNGRFQEYFKPDGDLGLVDQMHRLICSSVLGEKISIILSDETEDIVRYDAITDIVNSETWSKEFISMAFEAMLRHVDSAGINLPAELRKDVEQNIRTKTPEWTGFSGIPLERASLVQEIVAETEYLNDELLQSMFLNLVSSRIKEFGTEGIHEENISEWIAEAKAEVGFFNNLKGGQ